MTTIDLQELSHTDLAFAAKARQQLRASETLNYVEAARLAATRAQAREMLQTNHRQLPAWGWLAAPVAVAAVAFSLFRFDSSPALTQSPPTAAVLVQLSTDVNAPAADALMWVSDEAGPDFYRDLEFYEWLQSRSPAKPNA